MKIKQHISTRPRVFSVAVGLIWAFFSLTGVAVEIDVSVDRNPVNLDESFQISFTANASPDDDPDFSPLDANFEILNQSQSSQSSWVNGKSSKTIQWVLAVMAKQAGVLTIPAVSFGSDSSQPGSVLVNKTTSSQSSAQAGDDLFLQVQATPENPYVQSQVIYTLKLYRKVNIAQASLTEPELADAVIEKLGEDSNYNTQLNGEDYIVTERNYAIFPQQSGVMTVAPISLTAAVVVSGNRSRINGFFNRQSTRTKRVVSKAITLDVRSAAEQNKGQWLPAEQVYLEQKWSGDTAQMKVGEPLTRTLTLLAKGTTVGQLPELYSGTQKVRGGSGGELKRYPDQPVLKEQAKKEGMIAFREEKVAFIPSAAGIYQLPAVEVPWWNVKKQRMEKAIIPAVSVTAVGVSPAASAAGQVEVEAPIVAQPVAIQHQQNALWMGLSAFLAIGWLITLVYFFKPRKTEQTADIGDEKAMSLQKSIKALQRACKNDDASAAKDALLQWGRLQFNANSLGQLAQFCEARLRDEVLQLNHVLYGQPGMQWDGRKLMQVFTEHRANEKVARGPDDSLEPLYRL